jgi:hypothetical protein
MGLFKALLLLGAVVLVLKADRKAHRPVDAA